MIHKNVIRVALFLFTGILLITGPSMAQKGQASPITWQELENATFTGLSGIKGNITLHNGEWKEAPYEKGGASRPTVTLIPSFARHGDLNGDNVPDALVLLSENMGGSGDYIYLAVVTRRGKSLENIATVPIGDRVQVIDGHLALGKVTLKLLQPGPDDPACCPGDIVTRVWRWEQEKLSEMKATGKSRLSLAFLEGTTWTLSKWGENEQVPGNIHITLHFKDHHLTGQSGCNRYTVPVREGDLPGLITLTAPIASTRKSCARPLMSAENRYLKALQGVSNYGFYGGQLILSYTTKDRYGTLFFNKATP